MGAAESMFGVIISKNLPPQRSASPMLREVGLASTRVARIFRPMLESSGVEVVGEKVYTAYVDASLKNSQRHMV